MDFVGLVGSIASLCLRARAAYLTLKDVERDRRDLANQVDLAGKVVRIAWKEYGERPRDDDTAQTLFDSLKAIEMSMSDALDIVERLSKKRRVARFFAAGDHLAELKAMSTTLVNFLTFFQSAMGIDAGRELREIKRMLEERPVPDRHSAEDQARQQLHRHVESIREGRPGGTWSSLAHAALADQRTRAVVLMGLQEAGIVESAEGLSREEAADITAGMQEALADACKRKEDTKEQQYLRQVLHALELNDGGGGNCNQGTAATDLLPPHYLCPLTWLVMRDPVLLVESGYSYEREAIEDHLAESDIDPYTFRRISQKNLAPNHGLREAIEGWLLQRRMTHEEANAAQTSTAHRKADASTVRGQHVKGPGNSVLGSFSSDPPPQTAGRSSALAPQRSKTQGCDAAPSSARSRLERSSRLER